MSMSMKHQELGRAVLDAITKCVEEFPNDPDHVARSLNAALLPVVTCIREIGVEREAWMRVAGIVFDQVEEMRLKLKGMTTAEMAELRAALARMPKGDGTLH